MSKSTKEANRINNQMRSLIYLGLGLLIVWVLLSASFGLGQTLRCDITPVTCRTSNAVYNLILAGPIALGSVVLATGASHGIKNYFQRILLVVVATIVISYFAYQLMAVLTILIHGLK
jgi:hypothetical protein